MTLRPALPEALSFYWESPFPACLQDAAFRILDVNAAFAEFVGYPRAELIGRDPRDFLHADDRANFSEARRQLAVGEAGARLPYLREGRLVDAGGFERWFRATRRVLEGDGGEPMYFAMLQDTTLEHAAREQADRSVRELDDWFDLSPVGMVLFDGSGLLVRTNPAFDEMVGAVPVSIADGPAGLARLLAADDDGALAHLHPGSRPIETQGGLLQPGGRLRPLRSFVRCYRTASGERRYMGIVEDRSVEAERDLAQMQIDAMMDTAGVGIATFQESSGWVRRQPPAGATASTASLHNIGREIVMAESLPEFERLQAALKRPQRVEVRYGVQHPELGQRWLLTRVEPATLASGEKTASVVTLDITDQRQSQRRSEQLLREMTTILESTTAGIAYLRAGVLVRCNRRFETMLGLGADGVAGSSLAEVLVAHPSAEQVAAEIRAALAIDTLYEIEFAFEGRQRRWYSLSVRRASGATGHDEAIAVLTDVTRLKTQQLELENLARDRETMAERTRAILDSVLVGIVTVGAGGIEWMNRSARRMFGGDLADFIGEPMSAVATDEADHPFRRTHYLDGLVEGQAESFECRVQGRDGRVFWVVGNAVATGRDASGRQLTYALLDIERRRQAEAAALKAETALREVSEARLESEIAHREMLVKEVHHRIKNNLQGVAGLLQQIAVRKPEVSGAIDEVVGQVQAIAQVYGLQVGSSGPLALVSVLQAVVGSVQRTFGRDIACHVVGATAPEWMLPEVEAIPIALTMNELLTNAVKHSLQDASDDAIACTVDCGEAGVSVAISNPGRLASDFSLARIPSGVSGLGLVRALLPSRSASLTVEQAAGQVIATMALAPPGVVRRPDRS